MVVGAGSRQRRQRPAARRRRVVVGAGSRQRRQRPAAGGGLRVVRRGRGLERELRRLGVQLEVRHPSGCPLVHERVQVPSVCLRMIR